MTQSQLQPRVRSLELAGANPAGPAKPGATAVVASASSSPPAATQESALRDELAARSGSRCRTSPNTRRTSSRGTNWTTSPRSCAHSRISARQRRVQPGRSEPALAGSRRRASLRCRAPRNRRSPPRESTRLEASLRQKDDEMIENMSAMQEQMKRADAASRTRALLRGRRNLPRCSMPSCRCGTRLPTTMLATLGVANPQQPGICARRS